MIAKFQKSSSFKGFINYNEAKVVAGKAELVANSTLADSKSGYIETFEEVASLNDRVYKNKAIHFSISLPHGENLNDAQFTVLADDYLVNMGYENVPRLVYRHFDTEHTHIHIVTSCIDLDGKRVNDKFEKYRNKDVCRALEKKHGLKVTKGRQLDKESLSERNLRQYRYQNALKKAFGNTDLAADLLKVVPKDVMEVVRSEPLKNDDLRKLLNKRDKSLFMQVNAFIQQHQLLEYTHKEKLITALDKVRSSSKSRKEYMANMESAGIYSREIIRGSATTLTYGFKSNSFYMTENKLPKRFQSANLVFSSEKVKTKAEKTAAGSFSRDKQRQFLRNVVSRMVLKANSPEHLKTLLDKKGVRVIYNENASGIAGVSFVSAGIENAITFKGSEVHSSLSWNSIRKVLDTNSSIRKPKEAGKKRSGSSNLKKSGKGGKNISGSGTPDAGKLAGDMDSSYDEYEQQIKKQLKNEEEKDKNQDKDMGI